MAAYATASSAKRLTRNRGFLLFVAGQFVSRAGDALIALAAVWLVLEMTGNNPIASSAALAIEFLPFLLFGLLGGVVADRWDRRIMMAGVDLIRGLLLLLVPLLHAAGALQVWHIFVVLFVLSSLGRLFQPARQALIPDLVDGSDLVRANAIAEGTGQAAWIIGPALGGLLVATMGAANVFYLDAISFFLSAFSLLLLRPQRMQPARRVEGLWREAMGGIRHVRRVPVLRAVVSLTPSATVAFAPTPALLPVLVRGDFDAGSRVLGLLMACFFLGSIGGSALVGRLGERIHRGWSLLAALLIVGLAAGLLALAPWVVLAGVVLAMMGAAASAFNVAEYSILQTETPPELRGRVFAVAGVAAQFPRPPALLIAGLIAGIASVRLALGMMAWVALAAGLIALRSRVLRTTK